MSVDSIVTQVVAAIAVIIGLSYLVGKLLRRLGQPEVVGQLFVGIGLDPSLWAFFERHFACTLPGEDRTLPERNIAGRARSLPVRYRL